MKKLLLVLNALSKHNVRYDIINEETQIRIHVPSHYVDQMPHYIVIDEEEKIHANQISDLSDWQVEDFIKGLGIIKRCTE